LVPAFPWALEVRKAKGIMKTFLEVAGAAIARGLAVCPVHPQEKRGVLHSQYSHPMTKQSEINQLALDYPTHNVGIVGKCKLGHVAIFDIDAEGVLERFEQETETTLPETYVVQSQPLKKPWKRHFYFTHTPYSVSRLGKEINVKDWNGTPDDRGVYPTLFDLKGAGKGGYVVAEGSTHPSGEEYRGNGVTTYAPIPDALVDWILRERTKARSYAAHLRESVKKMLKETVDGQKKVFTKDFIRIAIKTRMGQLFAIGVRRRDIPGLIKKMIEDTMIDGARIAQEFEDHIRKEASNPGWRCGVLSPEWIPKTNDGVNRANRKRGHMPNVKIAIVEDIIVTLPARVLISDARTAVEKALKQDGSGLVLPRTEAGQRALTRALARYGYRVAELKGKDTVWELWV
jgi:hypothetical protein